MPTKLLKECVLRFQFLIGIINRPRKRYYKFSYREFQFLIGIINLVVLPLFSLHLKFQFLIGIINLKAKGDLTSN